MNRRILIIEDEDILLRTFPRFISKIGFDPTLANCGETALSLINAQHFDLILCDLRMPGMGGEETIKRIRQIYALRKQDPPPIVIMSGDYQVQSKIKMQLLRPAAVLLKPFGIPEMIECLERVLILA